MNILLLDEPTKSKKRKDGEKRESQEEEKERLSVHDARLLLPVADRASSQAFPGYWSMFEGAQSVPGRLNLI